MRWLLPLSLALALLLAARAAHADQTDPRLTELFDKLAAADAAEDAKRLEQAIWSVWLESGSATVDLLMQRSIKAMHAQRLDEAIGLLTTIVELKPDYAEGWNKRATVLFMLGRLDSSIQDCEKVLELEPRHFGALSGLGMIYEQLEDNKQALEAYERALTVNPHLEGAQREVERLKPLVEGERI
jgi:tetratricopeptide (TPR) repeat protein